VPRVDAAVEHVLARSAGDALAHQPALEIRKRHEHVSVAPSAMERSS